MQIDLFRLGLVLLLVVSGCAQESERRPPEVEIVRLMSLPRDHISKCERIPELRAACPDRIPVTEEAAGNRARSFPSGEGSFLFFSEWSGPYPGITSRNAPPRFFHVNVHGGDLDKAFGFTWPTGVTTLPNPLPNKRSDPLLLDTVTWFGKTGSLVLAPSFPRGGIDGDHLIFRWGQAGKEYAISIHAWSPLSETIEALKAVVGSTDAAH
jgi:hypothetical protein